MKETPILYSTHMVQAIMDDLKTKTRRVIKPQPEGTSLDDTLNGKWLKKSFGGLLLPQIKDLPMECPYGQPGDILWVRETTYLYGKWEEDGTTETGKPKYTFVWDKSMPAYYEASGPKPNDIKTKKSDVGYFKRPSIFMPKEVCRLRLQVKGVRVERLQDITVEDVIAEGLPADNEIRNPDHETHESIKNWNLAYAQFLYKKLWDGLNTKRGYGWETNPWVWVISFRKYQPKDEFRKPEGVRKDE